MQTEAVANVQLPPRAAALAGRAAIPIRGLVSDRSVFGVVQATGGYEPHVMDVIAERLPTGGVFVDVGANIGILSALAAYRVGPLGSVLAIEASPINYRLLLGNLMQIGSQHLKVLNRGVWDQHETLTLSHIAEGPGWSFIDCGQTGGGTPFTVACDTLDALVAETGVAGVHVLKVDVEGAEVKVLRGAKQVLAQDHPALILEINPHTLQKFPGTDSLALYECVRDAGYAMKVITRDGALIPVAGYGDLAGWFAQGHAWVDVLCE